MRRILVTGGNKGIGRAIATAIIEEHDDTFVLLGSRDLERGKRAAAAIATDSPGAADRVDVVCVDVASDDSVRAAAADVAARCGGDAPLHAVVNNAGVGGSNASLRDVLEVNTFGIHRVCEAFLPLIDPERGRIVNLTSASGPTFVSRCSPEMQRFFLDGSHTWPALAAFLRECIAIDGDAAAFAARGLGNGEPYGLSKAAANTLTLMLARQHPSLRINACTPGFIATDLTRHYAESAGKSPAELGMKPPSEGTRSALFLLFGEPEGSGRYYGSDAVRSPLDRYRSPGDPPYTGE